MRSAVIRYKVEMHIRDSTKFPIARVFEWNGTLTMTIVAAIGLVVVNPTLAANSTFLR